MGLFCFARTRPRPQGKEGDKWIEAACVTDHGCKLPLLFRALCFSFAGNSESNKQDLIGRGEGREQMEQDNWMKDGREA